MGQGEQPLPVSAASREPALSAVARAFMAEVAEARIVRRQVMLELDPASELFQAMTGSTRGLAATLEAWLEPFPGDVADTVLQARLEGDCGVPENAFLFLPEVEPRRFGLNNVQAYRTDWVEDPDGMGGQLVDVVKFGVDGASILDAGRLGADVIRHHGEHDLLWYMLAQEPLLLEQHTSPLAHADERRVPPFTLPVPLQAEIPEAIRYGHQAGRDLGSYLGYNETLIAAVLDKAREAELKLVLTFLSKGGGGGDTGDSRPPTVFDATNVEYAIDTPTLKTGIDRTDLFADLPWSADHTGQGSPAGEAYAFPVTASAMLTMEAREWYLSSLDPACPYKREYLGTIARAVAKLLVAAGDEAGIADLSGVVEAVEVFNEVDSRDHWVFHGTPVADPATAGNKWGRAYLHAAKGLRAGGLPASVRITLPGLTSYHGSVRAMHWSDRLAFVGGLIEGIVDEANTSYRLWGASYPSEILAELGSLVQGIDLHWYHHEDGDGPTHIGYLVLEVGELRDTILSSLGSHSPPVNLADFEDFPITVFESGWSLDGRPPADMVPVGADPEALLSAAESFQAHEVWRRLAGALAGGALIAGWHPWASRGNERFSRMGLRRDDPRGVEVASDATQRPAWFAYAVLTEVLKGRVKTGCMVLPQVATRLELRRKLGADPEHTSVVVLEFGLDAPAGQGVLAAEWAYMLLLDPFAPEPPPLLALAAPVASSGMSGEILEYRGSWYHTSGLIHPGTETVLPYTGDVHADAARRPVFPFAVPIEREPRLFVSPVRLGWKLMPSGVSTGTKRSGLASTTSAAAVHSVPSWYDDPSVPLPDRRAPQGRSRREEK